MNRAAPVLLTLDSVSRTFGGVQAVDGVSLSVVAGAVHGLIGPNGAGKTTVLNLISGTLRPDRGLIRLREERVDRLAAYRIAGLGIRRTYQNIRLFSSMSARDNVIVGLHSHSSSALWQRLCFIPAERREEARLRSQAMALLERVGLGDRAGERAGTLSYGDQRRLEIARALVADPLLLLLDEPTAGMTAREVEEIGSLIRSIAAAGTGILLVEHNMDLVMDVSNHLTVLNFGHVIAGGPPDDVRKDPVVIEAYLGSEA